MGDRLGTPSAVGAFLNALPVYCQWSTQKKGINRKIIAPVPPISVGAYSRSRPKRTTRPRTDADFGFFSKNRAVLKINQLNALPVYRQRSTQKNGISRKIIAPVPPISMGAYPRSRPKRTTCSRTDADSGFFFFKYFVKKKEK